MNGRATYLIAVAGSVLLCVTLTSACVVETVAGHNPTLELVSAFKASAAACLVVLAAGHVWRL